MALNTDRRLFQHEVSGMEENYINFLPPVGKTPDGKYQAIADKFLENLPDNRFGEGEIAGAYHAHAMTQFDRMIFEDCDLGTNVRRPSVNIPTLSGFQKVETVARQAGVTLDQAVELMATWRIIDDSGRLWPEFVRWTKVRGFEKATAFFEPFLSGLTEDGMAEPDAPMAGATLFSEMPYYQRPDGDDGEGDLDADDSPEDYEPAADDDDLENLVTADDFEAHDARYTEAVDEIASILIAGEIADKSLIEAVESSYDRRECWTTPDGKHHSDQAFNFSAPALFRYNAINNDIGDRDTWSNRQPPGFKSMVKRAKASKTPEQLQAIGKQFRSGKHTSGQGMVFWSAYKAKRRHFESKSFGLYDKLKARLESVQATRLGYAGAMLYKMQSGEVPVKVPMTARQWSGLWNTYKTRKGNASA